MISKHYYEKKIEKDEKNYFCNIKSMKGFKICHKKSVYFLLVVLPHNMTATSFDAFKRKYTLNKTYGY